MPRVALETGAALLTPGCPSNSHKVSIQRVGAAHLEPEEAARARSRARPDSRTSSRAPSVPCGRSGAHAGPQRSNHPPPPHPPLPLPAFREFAFSPLLSPPGGICFDMTKKTVFARLLSLAGLFFLNAESLLRMKHTLPLVSSCNAPFWSRG